MRRITTIVALLGLLMAILPGAVSAGRAVRAHEQVIEAFCDGTDAGTTAFAGLFDDGTSVFADLGAYLDGADPEAGPPTITSDPDATPGITGDPLQRTATLAMVDADGLPAGSAVVAFDLTAGEPQPIDNRDRNGNHWFTVEGTAWPLEGTADVTLPDGTTITLGCGGEQRDVRTFTTNPSSWIRNFDRIYVECDLANEDGRAYLGVDLEPGGEGFVFGDVDLVGTAMAGIGGSATMDGSGMTVEAELFDFDTGESLGSASADLTLTPTGESFKWTLPYTNGPIIVTGEYLAVAGTLTAVFDAGGEATWDASDCVAADQHIKDMLHANKGPKAKEKPPVNDTVAGATRLAIGQRVKETTRTTAPAAEVPTTDCLGFDVAHTLWYKVTATASGPLTVDTTGSDFDTSLAVYAAGAPGVAIACGDDVHHPPLNNTIEAIVTFDATAGATYLVQAGSFPGPGQQYGRLVLVVKP